MRWRCILDRSGRIVDDATLDSNPSLGGITRFLFQPLCAQLGLPVRWYSRPLTQTLFSQSVPLCLHFLFLCKAPRIKSACIHLNCARCRSRPVGKQRGKWFRHASVLCPTRVVKHWSHTCSNNSVCKFRSPLLRTTLPIHVYCSPYFYYVLSVLFVVRSQR